MDVKRGRATLAHWFAGCPKIGPCPPEFRIPVTITGYIDGVIGGDDGVSQEFSVRVVELKVDDHNARLRIVK